MGDEELKAEVERGKALAEELVEHVQRMGAGATALTVAAEGGRQDGQEFVVMVVPKDVNAAAAGSMLMASLRK